MQDLIFQRVLVLVDLFFVLALVLVVALLLFLLLLSPFPSLSLANASAPPLLREPAPDRARRPPAGPRLTTYARGERGKGGC